ncbi:MULTISPECIES: MazG nucleotide pyrophosphohydrolase domain-containing protein [unclassified Arthrobacter]|uniref:MazG nucleotide pyrophosphohydrolase domain-containing protein n=1 Tax=unclassified Arthrobacter TaxID=235627 RepID=UPI00159E7D1E|nr:MULTISPECIES: MazG nucleotide pyrophosphohydrolase domain-containing protein [unclassified Arthrobacter]MCQ9163524.1 nucleotide pyrophosphohydrolase [Arthrobacter sp. STN4]NVM99951.1 nucleotide pyrophosphohydrolase [Arthrobacter sp. SDTb3-6]
MTRTDPQSRPAGAGVAGGAGAALDRLASVVADLREHCLWTAALTHRSLIAYLVEESYELADVVEAPGELDVGALRGELGDILYQVVLHALLQSEAGGFTLADVADQLAEKLIRRNSHVFRPDGTLQPSFPDSIAAIERNYTAEKARERTGPSSVFDSLPAAMPALALAAKTLERAGAGPATAGPSAQPATPRTEEELGEALFDVVRAARAQGLDAERALRTAVRRFQEQHTPGE